jgi:hypothetical protein
MWFKLFVLVRTLVSAFLLSGYGTFSVALLLGAYVFLAVVSIKLVRRRPGALSLAGWLLALELVGAVLLAGSGGISTPLDLERVDIWGLHVVMLWVLPNAAILYTQRGRFTEIKMPGV